MDVNCTKSGKDSYISIQKSPEKPKRPPRNRYEILALDLQVLYATEVVVVELKCCELQSIDGTYNRRTQVAGTSNLSSSIILYY
jgi:hypothetical protein